MSRPTQPSKTAVFSPIVVSLLLACGAAVGQTTGTGATTGTTMSGAATTTGGATTGGAAKNSSLARGDAAFMKQAAHNGHAEVETSKVALAKGSAASVKTFAQQMVDDHTKANTELATLASSKGVEVPNEPSVTQKAKMKLLQAMDGATFDKRYADQMDADHKATVKLFRKAASDAKDADVKAFAAKTLPTLEHHTQMAGQLKTSTMASNASATKTSRAQ